MTYLEEARDLWAQFVPKAGQAETVQGELLRAVEKLRNEAFLNGNANWDDSFEIFLTYLSTRLLDESVFSRRKIEEINRVLARLHDYEDPLLEEQAYDDLGDRVVDYYRRYGSQPHKHNPRLHR